MKNVNKVTGLIALIAISGLLCAACGGGNIPVLVKAYDNGGVEQVNRAMYRAVAGGPLFAVTDTQSFKVLDDMHTKLGEPDATYTPTDTPTEFNVYYQIEAILSDGTITEIAPMTQYDFVKGLTVDVGDVPPDTRVEGLRIGFAEGPANPISFPVNGSTVTKEAQRLGVVREEHGGGFAIQTFVCYGDTRKFVKDESIPGPGGVSLNRVVGLPCIVLPFEPKVISGSASSCTLNISWNLTDIIAEFDDNPNGPYYFAKGWWNNLYVYASVD